MIIDEGDRAFGGSDEEGDGGTSSRVIARIKEFMSDTGAAEVEAVVAAQLRKNSIAAKVDFSTIRSERGCRGRLVVGK